LRVINVDALIPTVLDGIGIAELPEFIAAEYLADGSMEAILVDWTLPRGALYFVTPSARARAAGLISEIAKGSESQSGFGGRP
jgi:DNA-binding transcriptional LysR family regulator